MNRHALIIIPLLVVLTGCVDGPRSASQSRASMAPVRHTLKELRDLHVVKQERDYSCGSAALATLLIYYFGDTTTEGEVLEHLLSPLTVDERRHKVLTGFSLLDLKQVAQRMGYRAAGFRLTVTQLAQLAAPVIIHIEAEDYKHFAVLRGLDRGRVYLADPARGNIRMSLDKFLEEWSGVVFVVGKEGEENIHNYPLALPEVDVVQPEMRRLNAQLDLGMLIRTLPLR